MTTRQAFDAALLRVARGLGQPIDAEQADECFRQVAHFEAALFDEAADRLIAVVEFMPKPSQWRRALTDVHESRRTRGVEDLPEPATQDKPWCPDCDDTGWRYTQAEPPTVTPCSCRKDNPVYRGRQLRRPVPVHDERLEREERGY